MRSIHWDRKKIRNTVLALEVFFFVAAIFFIFGKQYAPVQIPINAQRDDLPKEEATAKLPDEEEWGDPFVASQLLELKKGSYSLQVTYETDNPNNFYFLDSLEQPDSIDMLLPYSKASFLIPYGNQGTSTFLVKEDISDLELQIYYQGGRLKVQEIQVTQTPFFFLTRLAGIAILVLLLDVLVFYVNWEWVQVQKRYIIGIFLLTLVASYPYLTDYIYMTGHDLMFHLMRIEGVKEGLLSGQFPVRIHPNYLMGQSYATPIFYPELFLYLAAVFRIFGISLNNAYHIFVILVNFATACIAFYSFSKMFRSKYIGMLGSILYTLATYRLIDIYLRAAVGEYLAMIFFPLIAYFLYLFFMQEEDGLCKSKWWLGVIAYTGVLQSHILSVVMVAIFSVLAALFGWKKLIRKERFFALCKAAVATLFLNLWFLIPIFSFYGLDLIIANYSREIQGDGLFLAQIFMNFFILGDGFSFDVEEGIAGEMPLSIGVTLVAGVFLFLLYWERKKKTRENKIGMAGLIFGLIALIFTMHWFPWDLLGQINLLHSVVSSIQFPWRFLSVVTVCFTLAACAGGSMFVENEGNRGIFLCVVSLVCILTLSGFVDGILQIKTNSGITSSNELDSNYIDGQEYIYQDTDVDQLIVNANQVTASNLNMVLSNYNKMGSTTRITVECPEGEGGYLELPQLYYPGYRASIEGSRDKLEVQDGWNHRVRILIPEGFQGEIRLYYSGLKRFALGDLISLFTALFLSGMWLYKKRKGKPFWPSRNPGPLADHVSQEKA